MSIFTRSRWVQRINKPPEEPGKWYVVHFQDNDIDREEVCFALESRFPLFTVNEVNPINASAAVRDFFNSR